MTQKQNTPLPSRRNRSGLFGVQLCAVLITITLWFCAGTESASAAASIGSGATEDILGLGTASLLGSDLTDPENDGLDATGAATDPSWNWKSISSNNEADFEGGEFSFNVFDNKLGPGNDKWCCDDATPEAPKNITVEFFDVVRLTHFTVSSANDVPDRDPLTWKIQGSNDGLTFEDIFVQDDQTLSRWADRLQVNKYTLDVPSAPYSFIRFECSYTAGTLYQVGEIEYFGLFGPGAPTIELLGTGDGALIGGDLTDPDNNGNEAAGPTDPSWDWESITSNNEPFFEGAEGSFNIFDNKVGGGGNKWCCDDPTSASPWLVDVKFRAPVVLKFFTITSGNDARDREPIRWAIRGSQDGINYTDIYRRDDPVSIWTAVDQVAKITLPLPAPPYRYLRYEVTDTAGPLYQLGEIEYFGTIGGVPPRVTKVTVKRDRVLFEITDQQTALVPSSVSLLVDGTAAPSTSSKAGTITTVTHIPAAPYAFGSSHPYEIVARDDAGNELHLTGTFSQPTPFFLNPATGEYLANDLPTPGTVPGTWATRYLFSSGTIDSIPASLTRILAAGDGSLLPDGSGAVPGMFVDVTSRAANHGNGGLFGNPLPYADEAVALGCCVDDFILLHVSNINISQEDDYTFGVHSDDGFALRIRGGTAVAVSGNGQLDAGDPEAVIHPANTGDSNTRGVYHLLPGTYRIEFFWWERGGGDNGELYFARGRFANDSDTPTWRLLNDPTPPKPNWFVDPVTGEYLSGNLPAPDVLEGAWATRYIFGAGTIDSIPASMSRILAAGDGTLAGTSVDVVSAVANHGGGGLFGNPLPYAPEATALGCCVDDFILLFVGNIRIEEEDDYTFGVHSDDGFAMRIRGATLIQVRGNGTFDLGDPEALVHPANTGDSSTRGVYHLTPGIYRVEFFWWERGGGDNGELYAAKGRFGFDGETTTWRLLGDATPGGTFLSLSVDAGGWSIVSSDPGGTLLNNWADANADLAATAGPPSSYPRLNVGDPDTNGGTDPFPKNAPGDQDDFALRATGKLVVPQAGTWTIGFNSDDGAYVKILGQTFNAVTQVGAGGMIDPASPDTVICDCLTGDSAVRAEITLAAGTYDIEFGMFERGGGAFLRGTAIQAGSPVFPILATDSAGPIVVPEAGIPLTVAPATGPANRIVSLTFSGANVVITYRPLDPGTYKLARSTDLKTWTVLPDAPVASGIDLIFTVPRGADQNVFFRVQK